jgi:hypothetical protein
LLARRGEGGEALKFIEEAIERTSWASKPMLRAQVLTDAADVLDLLGRPSEAAATRWEAQQEAELKRAVQIVEELGRRPPRPEEPGHSRVRVWLSGTSDSLVAGAASTIGFQIGPADGPSADATVAVEQTDHAHHELFVMLWTNDAEVHPNGHRVDFTQAGGTEPIYFTVIPRARGRLRLRLRVHSNTDGDLLQEFAVIVPVEEHAESASTVG